MSRTEVPADEIMPRSFAITGRLAAHFCADVVSAELVKSSYDAAQRVLSNPDRFPTADFETLEWLSEALFDLSGTAVMEGR